MSYATEHGFDDEEMGLGTWHWDETDETYECPSCGCVWYARRWTWWPTTLRLDADEPPRIACGECDADLDDTDQVDGVGCGDCGKDVCEPGTDYCAACNAAHDAAEAADPLHHHVWQSNDEFQAMVREITREQVRA